MRRELLELASHLARRHQPFALATVVARTPPISAQVGDTALVTPDGGFHGWVGGSCTRPTVIAEALKSLEDSRPRLVALDPDPASRRRPGLTVYPLTCHSGGSVEIHIQPVLPPPRLVVFGVSPTARALVRLGKAMGYSVDVVDPAAEASDFPDADSVRADARHIQGGNDGSDGAGAGATALYAVVATQGLWDEDATRAALALRPKYLGVMASGKRFGEMRALLGSEAALAGEAGASALSAIKNPAGLNLGGELPEEIALSILAEIVERRAAEKRAPAPVRPAGLVQASGQASVRNPSGTAPAQALDPVCGMTVIVSPGAPRAEHDGRTYYFCCGGCRETFLAAPQRFVTAASPGGAAR